MPDTYKLQYDGMTLTYPGWGGYVSYEDAPAFKTLTLYHSEGGTLTANTLTAYPGDTINLTTAYNTYWRFSGYQLTGDGTLVGNDYTFGTEDATICACYKVNAFTASGGWEKGSDVTVTAKQGASPGTTRRNGTVPAKYATVSYHTSNVPAEWYNTSNRWKITSTVSAYQITLNPKMNFYLSTNATAQATAVCLIGSTQTQSQGFQNNTNANYSKSFTNTTTGVNYGISAVLSAASYYGGYYGKGGPVSTARYNSTGTTGTWTATGIAP